MFTIKISLNTHTPIIIPVTSIPKKTACVIRDDSGVGIVESISAVVAAVWDNGRRVVVSQPRFS